MGRGAVSGTWGQLGVPQEGGVDRTAEHYRRESWEGDVPERIEPKARERTRGLAPTSLPTFPQWSLSCQLGNAEGSAKPKTGGGARGVTGAVCWDCFARRAPPAPIQDGEKQGGGGLSCGPRREAGLGHLQGERGAQRDPAFFRINILQSGS